MLQLTRAAFHGRNLVVGRKACFDNQPRSVWEVSDIDVDESSLLPSDEKRLWQLLLVVARKASSGSAAAGGIGNDRNSYTTFNSI
jgi:hypothetical protein